MTVIAAVKKNGEMWMMADSLTAWGWIVRTDRSDVTKITRFKNALIGCSGNVLFQNVLRYFADRKRDMYESAFDNEHDVTDFFQHVYAFVKERYSLGSAKENEISKLSDASFMVATSRRMFEVAASRDICVFDNFAAIGSGNEIALGAIHSLYPRLEKASEILRQTFNTVCFFHRSCGGKMELRHVSREISNAGRSNTQRNNGAAGVESNHGRRRVARTTAR